MDTRVKNIIILTIISLIVLTIFALLSGILKADEDKGIKLPNGEELYVPRKRQIEGQGTSMEALLEGQLILRDGCLRVITGYDKAGHLIIWPADIKINVQGDVIEVVSNNGYIVGRVGEPITLSGGEINPNRLLEYRGLPISNCPGPYWRADEFPKPLLESIDDD